MKLVHAALLLAAATPALAQTPEVRISDSVAAEGNFGYTPFTFTVSLSAPSASTVLVKWATERCTATPKEPCASDGDYFNGDGVLEFPPGTVSRTLTVDVIGDTDREGQEAFLVALSEPVNAVLAALPQGQGQGIILNDDGPLPAPARADFNGDGRTDIVWRNQTSNRLVVWLMDGLNRVSGDFVTAAGAPVSADPGAVVAGTADFDLDGRTDLLWRHETTGRIEVWFMDDRTVLSTAALDPAFVPTLTDPTLPDLSWRVAGLGDFDGDGHVDVVFRHSSSHRLVYWLLDGVHRTAGGYFEPDRPVDHEGWPLAGVWDVDQEGIADLVFRNTTSGALVTWFMDDTQDRKCGTYLNPPTLADLGWQMVGPR